MRLPTAFAHPRGVTLQWDFVKNPKEGCDGQAGITSIMAYGRLEVFYPDGTFKTFLLNEPNISMGRSTGNMIALDVDGISRYHMSIAHVDGETRVTDLDSANGTFIDGTKLESNTPRTLYGGEEIQVGEVRMVFHSFDETPTRPILVPEETTRRIEIKEAEFTLAIIEPDQAVSPGAHISAQITINNNGLESDRYTVDVSGAPADWMRIDRRELEVAGGKSGDVVINFKPRRRPDSTPGDYPITVTVRSKSQPASPFNELSASFVLHVLPYGGFGMALETRQVRTGQPFRLHIHNQGSAALPLTISARDLSDSLRVNVPQPRYQLAPGQRALVQGQVTTKRLKLFGEPRRFPVDLLVRSGDAAGFLAATRLYVVERPPLPSWSKYLIGGLAVAAAALILVGLAILFQPPSMPVINRYDITESVREGDLVTLSWDVENAASYAILVNGVQYGDTLPREQNSAQLDLPNITGEISVTLRAINNSEMAEQTRTVVITPRFAISDFSIAPTLLLRYVAQTVNLNWNVPGATSVQITGLESFSTAPLQSSYAASGTISVIGIPTVSTPLTITLVATNEAGESVTDTRTIELLDPQCTASTGDVALYGAPESVGQIVATIPAGTTVSVNAQDNSGGWLRVLLPGGAEGWGNVNSLTCVGFMPSDLLRVISVPTALPDVPTATPTPTLRPTLTPTSTSVMVTPTAGG